jgi:tetratricopeptide (TPR) repeat protein
VSKWFQWIVLTSITGSPLGSIVILVVFWWTVDRFTFQVLPDPVRGFLRWQRAGKLQSTIAANPNDRRARYELADIYVQQRRHAKAVELLRANYEAGEDDNATLYLLAIASMGSGQYEQAERLLLAVHKDDPDYKQNEIELAIGRVRTLRGDLKGAEEALVRYLAKRRSTVEGRVLLAKLRDKAGDAEGAKRLREEAWNEYVGSTHYQRRRDRFWAWRANPKRPITYAVVAVVFAISFARFGAPVIAEAMQDPAMMEAQDY